MTRFLHIAAVVASCGALFVSAQLPAWVSSAVSSQTVVSKVFDADMGATTAMSEWMGDPVPSLPTQFSGKVVLSVVSLAPSGINVTVSGLMVQDGSRHASRTELVLSVHQGSTSTSMSQMTLESQGVKYTIRQVPSQPSSSKLVCTKAPSVLVESIQQTALYVGNTMVGNRMADVWSLVPPQSGAVVQGYFQAAYGNKEPLLLYTETDANKTWLSFPEPLRVGPQATSEFELTNSLKKVCNSSLVSSMGEAANMSVDTPEQKTNDGRTRVFAMVNAIVHTTKLTYDRLNKPRVV